MQYHFSHICQVLNGQTLQQKTDAVISAICTDTRQQIIPDKALFFCLTGRNDGHQYIMQAYQKGIRNFIVSKDIDITACPEANICKVADTLNALQEFAAHHRAQFALPVIGITGSNGKTIVKEWLYQLLSPEKKVVKSPKSYNSQIGVPLSVTLIEPEHELGIFEAGISTTGEMV
ncbi:MAG TPA: Mur ligase family protein, partial [Chitinophagales bacterium]|nr:Mur ligase family protein [Chitinophagales bacterium]